MEIVRRLADTLHLAVRAARAREPSAATTVADRPGAFPHAEAPAWAAGADFTVVEEPAAAVAGVVNRDDDRDDDRDHDRVLVRFLVA